MATTRKSIYRNEKRLIWKRDGSACFYCMTIMKFEEATIEHLIPKSREGSDTIENLVLACFNCNNEVGILPLNRKVNYAIKTRVELILKNQKI